MFPRVGPGTHAWYYWRTKIMSFLRSWSFCVGVSINILLLTEHFTDFVCGNGRRHSGSWQNENLRTCHFRSCRLAFFPYRKFSTSIRSLPPWSSCEYRIHRPSGETQRPRNTGLSVAAMGLIFSLAKLKN
jgi:hypothetical protein